MVKLGIIGVGNMGKNHLRVALELNRFFDVVGFFEANEAKRDEIEQLFNVKGYESVEQLLDEVEACIIAVPSSLHKEIGLIAAEKGVHTLMEKPICLEMNEAEELKRAYKGLIFMVGHIERYNPAVIELSKILKDEEIISIEAHRCSPYDKRIFDTNVIMDLMIHDVDIVINELCTSEIKNIQSFGNNMHSPKNFDYVQAIFKFEDNVVCSVVASRSTEDKIRTINVNTKDGYIVADLLNKKLTITRRTNCSYRDNQDYKQDNIVETIVLPFVEPLKAEQTEFYNSIIDKRLPKTNMESSTKTLEVCQRIQNLCEETR